MNADGTSVTNLTNHPANDGNIAWSPDGSRVAFVSDRDGNFEIYTIDATGENLQRLTNNSAMDVFPSWSPDGNEIVFRSDRADNNEIYIMSANGSNLRRITNDLASDDYPSWSADGSQIVFSSDRALPEDEEEEDTEDEDAQETGPRGVPGQAATGNYNIYTINADRSGLTLVTSNPTSEKYPDWGLQP
jgi:Tol biopolymer transport system component